MFFIRPVVALFALSSGIVTIQAADTAALKAEVGTLITKAEAWLLTQQQESGAFAPDTKFAIGITALAVEALATEPASLTKEDQRTVKAVGFLLGNQQANGGVYREDEGLGNYGTALTLMALSTTGLGDPAAIKRMQEYLFGLQNDTEGSLSRGGTGYGSRGAGHEDLSNTAMAIEGLVRSGVPASDPHLQKAIAFLEHCQDLSSHNDMPWAGNSGGAVYIPDESKAGGSWNPESPVKEGDPKPELQPYGGMTYQLISSYVALDLKPGDPRLDAALGWVKKNYLFDANPGMPEKQKGQGLFYYYMAMAKTFDLLDVTTLDLGDGRQGDWRLDLFNAIKEQAAPAKNPDGSEIGVIWINRSDRWAEGMPTVTAGYLIKALKRIHQSL